MPAYNCEKYVKQAIDSILDQTYKNFELLIADDCSSDSTKQMIDSYSDIRIKRFHNSENLGYLKASNKLFKQCTGDYISFQDADDYSDTERFKKLMEYLNANPDIDCVGSAIKRIDVEGQILNDRLYPLSDSDIRSEFLKNKIVFTGSALLLKKKVITKTGIYNEYFDRIGSEDIYLFSFILQNFKVANLSDALYYYRTNPASVTATHKNPKAGAGHQLILWFYKNRQKNKPDYIQSGDWQKADKCAQFFLATNKINYSRLGSFLNFLSAWFRAPAIGSEFVRYYFSHLKHSFQNS